MLPLARHPNMPCFPSEKKVVSHYLSKIRIRNHRSIKEVEFFLDPYSPLVGRNNSGKSNILNAIQWLIGSGGMGKQDFNDSGQPLEVEGCISGITEELVDSLFSKHAAKMKPLVKGGDLRLRRTMDEPGTAKNATLEVFKPDENDWGTNPAGIPEAIKPLFPEVLRVEAMTDAQEQAAKNKATTTLEKLIGGLTKMIEREQQKELEALFKQVKDALAARHLPARRPKHIVAPG